MSLYSWDYLDDSGLQGWFRRARAYLDASQFLFRGMEAGALPQTYHHAQVAAFLFVHSLEAFLKAAVEVAQGELALGHRLDRLYAIYARHFDDERYAFTGAIEDLARGSEQPPTEFLRYPVDRFGKPWFGQSHFDLSIWLEQVQRFDGDYRRLEPLILQRIVREG